MKKKLLNIFIFTFRTELYIFLQRKPDSSFFKASFISRQEPEQKHEHRTYQYSPPSDSWRDSVGPLFLKDNFLLLKLTHQK